MNGETDRDMRCAMMGGEQTDGGQPATTKIRSVAETPSTEVIRHSAAGALTIR